MRNVVQYFCFIEADRGLLSPVIKTDKNNKEFLNEKV